MVELVQDGDNSSELVTLVVGYVPKDLAYHLSTICDNPNVFDISVKEYRARDSICKVEFTLRQAILLDDRLSQLDSDVFLLTNTPNMPKKLREALDYL